MRRFKKCCHLVVSGRLGNNVITSHVCGCALFRLFESKRVCFSVRWKHLLRISQFYSLGEVYTSLDGFGYGRVETEPVWW